MSQLFKLVFLFRTGIWNRSWRTILENWRNYQEPARPSNEQSNVFQESML